MKVCNACGTKQRENAKFCSNCGEYFSEKNTISREDQVSFHMASECQEPYMRWWEGIQNGRQLSLLKQEMKAAYFWYKVTILGAEILLGAILFALCSYHSTGTKWAIAIIGVVLGGMIVYWGNKKHYTAAGNSANIFEDKASDEEKQNKLSNLYGTVFGTKGLKAVEYISWALGGIFFLCFLEDGFLEALRNGIMMLSVSATILSAIWALKFPGVLAAIVCIALLGNGVGNETGLPGTIVGNQQIGESNVSSTHGVEITDAFLDTSGESTLFVIQYKWTNTTDGTTSANWNVGFTVFQDGMELQRSYGYDWDDDTGTREVRPGVTIEAKVAFYLDSLISDVEVCVGPAINISDTVWFKEVYTLEIED